MQNISGSTCSGPFIFNEPEPIPPEFQQLPDGFVPDCLAKVSPKENPEHEQLFDELEKLFLEKRTDLVYPPDGFLVTPLHILKQMSDEHRMRMHSEVYMLHWGRQYGLKDYVTYRVEIYVGRSRGIGQAPLRGLAFQLAALDILDKLKRVNGSELPLFGLPPGARVNPKVIRDLFKMCRKANLMEPVIEFTNSDKAFEDDYLFECTVTVGEYQAKVKSDSRYFARRLACLEMYNKLAVTPYPPMCIGFGPDCIGMQELKELGYKPMMSGTKRTWFELCRLSDDGKLVKMEDDEPDDGDTLDPNDCPAESYEYAKMKGFKKEDMED